MKKTMAIITFALTLLLASTGAYAATYDATGNWDLTVTTDLSAFIPTPIPVIPVFIDQPVPGNTFTFLSGPIDFFEGESIDGDGVVLSADYTNKTFEIASPQELIAGIFLISVDNSFTLISDTDLEGVLTLNLVGNPALPTIPIEYTGARAVPVPAAIWLFASGLIGLVGLRKKQK